MVISRLVILVHLLKEFYLVWSTFVDRENRRDRVLKSYQDLEKNRWLLNSWSQNPDQKSCWLRLFSFELWFRLIFHTECVIHIDTMYKRIDEAVYFSDRNSHWHFSKIWLPSVFSDDTKSWWHPGDCKVTFFCRRKLLATEFIFFHEILQEF